MILRNSIACFLMMVINSCSSNSPNPTLDDPMSSGREFIESSLKGDYVNARKHVLADSLNLEYFSGLQNFNEKMSSQDKEDYKSANIIIDSIKQLSDTVSVIHYSNTFKKQPAKIKMLKVGNDWLVDFKYTFQ